MMSNLKKNILSLWGKLFGQLSFKTDVCIVTTNIAWGGSEAVWFQVYKELRKKNKCVIVFVTPPLYKIMLEKNLISKEDKAFHTYIPNRELLNSLILFLRLTFKKPKAAYISHQHAMDAGFWLQNFKFLETPYVNFVPLCLESAWPDDGFLFQMGEAYQKSKKILFDSRTNMDFFDYIFGFQFSNKLKISHAVSPQNKDLHPIAGGNTVKLGLMARFDCYHKGIDILIQALPKLRNQNWELVIAGHGFHENLIRRLIEMEKLQHKVKVVTNFNLNDFFTNVHVALFPSRFEGTPLLQVQALLAGKVCVVNNVGGLGETVKDNINGYVSKYVTPESFAEALDRCLDDKKNWPSIMEKSSLYLGEDKQGKEITKTVIDLLEISHNSATGNK